MTSYRARKGPLWRSGVMGKNLQLMGTGLAGAIFLAGILCGCGSGGGGADPATGGPPPVAAEAIILIAPANGSSEGGRDGDDRHHQSAPRRSPVRPDTD